MRAQHIDLRQKLDVLERYHWPIYLGKKYITAYKAEPDLYSRVGLNAAIEIERVYEQAFKEGRDVSQRACILRSFVSNFPVHAWLHSRWLRELWSELRKQETKEARQLLRAIGNGFATPAYRLRKFQHQLKVEEAQRMYQELLDPTLDGSNLLILSFQQIREGGRVKENIGLERPLIKECLKKLGYPMLVKAVLKRIKRDTPAHTLRMVVAKVCGVREADLGRKSLVDANWRVERKPQPSCRIKITGINHQPPI